MKVLVSQVMCHQSEQVIIASHDTMQKTFSFLPLKQLFTCDKMLFNISQLQFVWYPCFWIIPNAFKPFETVVRSTPNDSASSACAYHESSWSNTTNSSYSNFFTRAFFIFNIKIIIFEASKPLSACCFLQSMVAVSLN